MYKIYIKKIFKQKKGVHILSFNNSGKLYLGINARTLGSVHLNIHNGHMYYIYVYCIYYKLQID